MTEQPPLARRDAIAQRLARGQSVTAAALAAEFAVSEDAVRRDLRALAAEGRCRRVYGGALPAAPTATPMAVRMEEGRERKEALARLAATTIRPGELLFLDSGSTNLALVGFLPDDRELQVATNSVAIAAALIQRQGLRLHLVGGVADPMVGGCVDADAVLALARLNIDRCFLGACAVDPDSGISAHDSADAAFKRALLAASGHSLVLATSDKFSARAPFRVAAWERIEGLVAEADAPPQALAQLARSGVRILQAAPPA